MISQPRQHIERCLALKQLNPNADCICTPPRPPEGEPSCGSDHNVCIEILKENGRLDALNAKLVEALEAGINAKCACDDENQSWVEDAKALLSLAKEKTK